LFTAVSSGVQPYSVTSLIRRAGVEKQLRRFEVSLARGEHERRQAASAASDEPGHDDIRVVVSVLRRLRAGSTLTACAPRPRPAPVFCPA
jgi:hypothetical protein